MPVPMNLKRAIIIIFALSVPAVLFMPGKHRQADNLSMEKPQRIISLSPSVTREIIDLGAAELLAGVTDYTLHPELEVESVGAYMNPNLEKIIRLKPDLVLLSEEDRYIQNIPLLEKFGLRIEMMGRNAGFGSMCENYRALAGIVGRGETAELKIAGYIERIGRIKKPLNPARVLFLVSVKPLVTVSAGSHISSVIADAGGVNVFYEADIPYPILTLESLAVSGADAVVVMQRGDEKYLYSLLAGYRHIAFVSMGNIFVVGDENIPYYTPEDYTVSVEKIASLINMIKR